jgi:hypothetical protein
MVRITLFLFLFLPAVSMAAAKPVQWEDITDWKEFGTRWAAAQNQDGKVIAIYDLSFPKLLSRVPLGLMGTRQVKKSEVLSMIKEFKKDPSTDPKKADEAIAKVRNLKGDAIEDEIFPENWFTQIPWKNKIRAMSEPTSFDLSEIDFDKVQAKPHQMELLVEKAADQTPSEV